jgi:hypothetical protein
MLFWEKAGVEETALGPSDHVLQALNHRRCGAQALALHARCVLSQQKLPKMHGPPARSDNKLQVSLGL